MFNLSINFACVKKQNIFFETIKNGSFISYNAVGKRTEYSHRFTKNMISDYYMKNIKYVLPNFITLVHRDRRRSDYVEKNYLLSKQTKLRNMNEVEYSLYDELHILSPQVYYLILSHFSCFVYLLENLYINNKINKKTYNSSLSRLLKKHLRLEYIKKDDLSSDSMILMILNRDIEYVGFKYNIVFYNVKDTNNIDLPFLSNFFIDKYKEKKNVNLTETMFKILEKIDLECAKDVGLIKNEYKFEIDRTNIAKEGEFNVFYLLNGGHIVIRYYYTIEYERYGSSSPAFFALDFRSMSYVVSDNTLQTTYEVSLYRYELDVYDRKVKTDESYYQKKDITINLEDQSIYKQLVSNVLDKIKTVKKTKLFKIL